MPTTWWTPNNRLPRLFALTHLSGVPGHEEAKLSLRETRGEHYPPPGDTPTKVVDYVGRLLKDGDGDAFERYKRAAYNLQFVDGRQWIDLTLLGREFGHSAPFHTRTT